MSFPKIKTTIKAEVENVGDEIILHINPEDLKEHLQQRKRLKEYKPKELIKIGDYEIIVVKQLDIGTAILFRNCLPDSMKFDANTVNYAKSSIRKYLNEDFADEFEKIVGKGNIIPHVIDLTTDDGRKDYGKVTDRIGLLPDIKVKEFVDILDQYPVDRTWLTATACSINKKSSCVRCVNDNGVLDGYDCRGSGGVRPFCILNSEIFVSE